MKDIADEVLDRIRSSPHETEVVEFKDRKNLSKDEMASISQHYLTRLISKEHHMPG